jgi:hypothetical protein
LIGLLASQPQLVPKPEIHRVDEIAQIDILHASQTALLKWFKVLSISIKAGLNQNYKS